MLKLLICILNRRSVEIEFAGNRAGRRGVPCKADGSGDAANADGEEAVATVQQKPYDLVLMNAHAENGRRLGDHDDPQDRRAGAAGADRRIDRQCAGRSARMLPRRRDE